MKAQFLCLIIACTGMQALAQSVPEAFSYSAVARNTEGLPVSEANIGLQISIREGAINGNLVFQETHDVNTDNLGVFSLSIGSGTSIIGDLASVGWSDGIHFLEVGMDLSGGSNFSLMGTTQLLSVPYAFHAKSASSLIGSHLGVSETGDTLYFGEDFVVIPGISGNNGGLGNQYFTPGQGVTDIDGNDYPSIMLSNGQEWMAENLRTTTYANGDPIPTFPNPDLWSIQTSGAWVLYNNDEQYEGHPYGLLYNWYTAVDERNVCPSGWHVPDEQEWNALASLLGGSFIAGGKMKSTGLEFWDSPNLDASNLSGFNGLPAGARLFNGTFGLEGIVGCWWSTAENDANTAWPRAVDFEDGVLGRVSDPKPDGYSIRCLKD